MRYPKAIQSLVEKLSALPSVGPKTAERYAFYLLRQSDETLNNLASAISELKAKTTLCGSCQAITETNPCPICSDLNRSNDILCVVENTQDLLSIEATRQFSGKYFVLGGLINTINEVKPDDLNIDKLIKKIKKDQTKEIILALNFTLEGETTSLYLGKLLRDHLKITRLAKGLPAGSDLEYADEMTLTSALKNRNEIK
jgi:recombination protein RecR